MLKEMVVTVKRTFYETYSISSKNGYEMPMGTKETVEFVENVKTEIKRGGTKPDENQTSETCEITDIDYEDEA